MKIIFEQTGPIYFTENLNLEEKREFPMKILIDDKEVFTGAVFDGDDYNPVSGDGDVTFWMIGDFPYKKRRETKWR